MGEYRMIEAQVLRREGQKIKEIAKKLDVSRRTVHNYLTGKVYNGRKRPGRSSGSPKLKKYIPFIDSKLNDDLYLNGELLFEKLIGLGYSGKTTILRDYLQKRREEIEKTAVFRFETLPGHQAQVDWGHFGYSTEDGIRRKRYLFVFKLGYSRRSFMTFTDSMEQPVLFACLILAFKYFGGIPEEILFDNMKTAFLYDKLLNKWSVHPKLLNFSNHYGFTARRCRVRRPQTKGKVEREIRYVRGSFVPRFTDMSMYSNLAVNDSLLNWLKQVDAKTLREFQQTRQERFILDQEKLHALPATPFDYRSPEKLIVNRNGFFTYETNRYSILADYIGKELLGLRDPMEKTMSVYDGNKLIREYKLFAKGQRKKHVDLRDEASLIKAWKKGRDDELRRAKLKIEAKKLHAKSENIVQDPGVYDKLFNPALEEVLS